MSLFDTSKLYILYPSLYIDDDKADTCLFVCLFAAAVSGQVPISAETDSPANADLFVGDDEAQEGQEPRPKARGPGG